MWCAICGIIVMVYVQIITGKLTGDHICQEERRYIINATEYYIKNATIRNYQWCLHVPPRCSFYTTKQINASKIVEKEITDSVEVCCPGFIETQSNTCSQQCPDCVHGICELALCHCFPGFKGDKCDTSCGPLEWGANCKLKCTCERGSCDSITGNCVCPSGYNGSRCHLPCPSGTYGNNCKEICNCTGENLCDSITGSCPIILKSTSVKSVETTTPLTTTTLEYVATEPIPPTDVSKTEVVHVQNNGKFQVDKIGIQQTTTQATSIISFTTTKKSVEMNTFTKNDLLIHEEIKVPPAEAIEHSTISANDQIVQIKTKVLQKEIDVTTGLQQEENYLNDEAHKGNINFPPQINENDVVNNASAATALSIAVIVIAFAIILANKYRKKKKKLQTDEKTNHEIPSVSVYTNNSIFHTPLPDPPPFENSTFITPVNNTDDSKQFETQTVCNSSNLIKDPKDYLYDHPPPTSGASSYRAGSSFSIPAPVSALNFLTGTEVTEPVYDEIPSGVIPTPVTESSHSTFKSTSLYINTCAKTRF